MDVRRLFAALALALLALGACGGSAEEAGRARALVRHDVDVVPGMSIELPRAWTVVENAAALSPSALEAIARANPALAPLLDPAVYQAVLSNAFLAVGERGLISITAAEAPPGITLGEVIEANLRGLESIPGCIVVGDPREVVEQPCGPTWNLRWRLRVERGAETLEIHNHEHVFLHDDRVVLVNLSTVGEPANASLEEVLESSTRSIRLEGDAAPLKLTGATA